MKTPASSHDKHRLLDEGAALRPELSSRLTSRRTALRHLAGTCASHHATRRHGLTLIETLAAVAILAILATVVYPNLRAPLLRARRSDAQLALMQLQIAQERWRAGHNQYGTLADLSISPASPLGHYRLAVELPAASGFELLAEAVGSQADDTACRVLRLSRAEGRTQYASGPDAQARNPDDTNRRCWTQ